MKMKRELKKIVLSTMILLLAATVISFASGNNYKEKPSDNNGGFFQADNDYSSDETPESTIDQTGGFFSDGGDPGNRPGEGDGIGQNAPLQDGLHVLLTCCAAFVLVKFANDKHKKK